MHHNFRTHTSGDRCRFRRQVQLLKYTSRLVAITLSTTGLLSLGIATSPALVAQAIPACRRADAADAATTAPEAHPVGPELTPAQVRQNKIKSVYLINFARFVMWPQLTDAEHFKIGVLGKSPILNSLERLAQTRDVIPRHNKTRLPLQILELAPGKPLEPCQILFISQSVESTEVLKVLEQLKTAPTLIVGEAPDFLDQGGTVGLEWVDGKNKFSLNLADANAKGLNCSAQLLKAAHRIINEKQEGSSDSEVSE